MALNRDQWDERVPIHVSSSFYGVDDFLRGESKLKAVDLEEMGDVQGARLLHLQCHFGLDTLSWAREGARVVGLDYSEAAVAAARELAERAGIEAEFICADVHDAPEALGIGTTREAFDRVVTGVGALCWVPRIRLWAQTVARCVRPGGVLHVREGHPMMWAMADARTEHGHALAYPYFEVQDPVEDVEQGTYADREAQFQHRLSHTWNHGLGETLSALIDAGFTLEFLHEHREADWQAFEHLVEGEDGMWRLPDHAEQLPLMYSLRAKRL